MSDPRFPIGPFAFDPARAESERAVRIGTLEEIPAALRVALRAVRRRGLDTPYRTGGWTVRQVVHHLADSHIHAFVRCKTALTERQPVIHTYREERWAELADARLAPAAASVALLDALHARWVVLLRSLDPCDFARTVWLPRSGISTIDEMLALYAWHGRHHVAQIAALARRPVARLAGASADRDP